VDISTPSIHRLPDPTPHGVNEGRFGAPFPFEGHMGEDSKCIGHEPCPKCGSTDNLGRYDDGHGYCFGCGHYEHASGEPRPAKLKGGKVREMVDGEIGALPARGITEETCRKWNYRKGTFNGKPVQIANYCDERGVPVAQKLRFANKDFLVTGDKKALGLYGQWLWRDGGKQVVVTEGEVDALTVSQLQQLKWPVVSVPNGAQGAAKAVAKAIEWLERFEKVIFLMDDDEPGRKAAQECAALITPGRAYIARIDGFKDANEALKAGQGAKVIDAIWGAKVYRPDGIISIDDILEEAEQPIEMGKPWCFPTLTRLTYGRRPGEVYTLGAGTGIGKTDFMTQQIEYDVNELGETVGVFYLEQKPVETAKRIAGKAAGKRFHVPDAGWTREEQRAALQSLRGKVHFYDNFGETDWGVVKAKIRYMAVSLGIRHIFLDHLTAMADTANEKESIEQLMKEMAGLANELGLIIHCVSHLSTPEGKPHEEGGRVMIRHFKGSRAIGFWSFFMFGLERNQQDENPERRSITIFRCLKDRYTGQATGQVFALGYDADTGRLYECEMPGEGGSKGFKDETEGGDDDISF